MKYGDYLVHNGIDRLNSGSGYESGNCVSCCKTCNLAKNDLGVEEFRTWVRAIYGRFGSVANVVHVG